jgi:hypothetical protein
MKKKILTILIAGIILRLVLSFSTFHADIVPFDFAGRVIAKGNILNFYDYLWELPANDPILKVYPKNLFNYPPAVYFFQGGASRLFTWIVEPQAYQNFLFDFPSTLGNWQLNLLLLLLKLPYFGFDIAIAYLLMGLFKAERQKLIAFAFWIFNPINLYATYMMGQFDIIPVFFSILCLSMVIKKADKLESTSLIPEAAMLGLGGAFKIFPLLFLIPLATLKKGWMDRIKILATGGAVYLLSILPFLSSKGFRATALLAGQTTKSLYAQIPISGGESIILFLAFLIFIYIVFLHKPATAGSLWQRFFVLMLIFFVLTHWHPQWFLWITPFLIIDFVKANLKSWLPLIISFFSFLGLLTFFDAGLTVWLFAPIAPGLYAAPDIWKLLGLRIDINLARSLLQSLFVGSALYYFYIHFPRNFKTSA